MSRLIHICNLLAECKHSRIAEHAADLGTGFDLGPRPEPRCAKLSQSDPVSDFRGCFLSSAQKVNRAPAQMAKGSAGDRAFSLIQLFGLAMKAPPGVNELEVRKPAFE